MPDLQLKMNISLTTKTAAPRKPFKTDPLELLEEGNAPELKKWALKAATDPRLAQDFVDKLDTPELKEKFQKFVDESAGDIAEDYTDGSSLPYLIAPTFLEHNGFTFPVEAFTALNQETLIDEYYGLLYNPKRAKRFSEGVWPAIRKAVKDSFDGPLDLLKEFEQNELVFDGWTPAEILTEFTKLYGRQALKAFWRNLDEDDLKHIKSSFKELYTVLEDLFGGGLEDEAPKE